MMSNEKNPKKGRRRTLPLLAAALIILSVLSLLGLAGCSDSNTTEELGGSSGSNTAEESEAPDYTPLVADGWELSTPAEQGLDPALVTELYDDAADLDRLYGVLVVKNGYLVAEKCFNEGSVGQKARLQSATKSIASALVGIALDQGCLTSVEQEMLDSFPEVAGQITDPRKEQITIRQMLQMRAGYPWEETHPDLWEGLMSGHYPRLVEEFPLTADPGTDWDGQNNSSGDLHLTARNMARFGQLYLDDGEYEGNQIISADWVHESLQTYSEAAWDNIGRFRDMGYGYHWWSARAGDRHVNPAWGHGGQLIVLVDAFDMVVVTTADPFYLQSDGQSWKHEKATISLVADFVSSLPTEQSAAKRWPGGESCTRSYMKSTARRESFS